MRRFLAATCAVAALAMPALLPARAPAEARPLTLETIMSNPDWIGPAVESPYWSGDSSVIYYALKRNGSSVRDLYQVAAGAGTPQRVDDPALATVDGASRRNRAGSHAAFVRHGDVFVRTLADGSLRQLTRTATAEEGVQWSADGRSVQFRRGHDWFAVNLATGTLAQLSDLRAAADPEADAPDQLERKQLRLFKTLRGEKADAQAKRTRELELALADGSRPVRPFWLGADVRIVASSLSPDGRSLLVVTEPADFNDGKHPQVHHYVTESGYNTEEATRIYVGHERPAPQSLWLLDLTAHAQHKLTLDPLPGIHDDPLAEQRKARQAELRAAGHGKEADALAAPDTREVSITYNGPGGMVWSDDGKVAAVMFRASDNKDRWIASLDPDQHTLVPQHRLHDAAWINWNFNGFGFVPGSHTLWYLSEESGYSQLYSKALDGKARQLTAGVFEVSQPALSADGQWVYLRANVESPVAYDVYRVPTTGGPMQRLTQWQGVEGLSISPDNQRLLVQFSASYMRSQLGVVDVDGSHARQLTDTRSAAWRAMHWIEPEFVQVPSSHGDFSIHAKVYKAPDFDPTVKHPAVIFVHGAGYTQGVHKHWPYYFREQMFDNLLAHEGYVVISLDYRASEGYGRDWRTAIYRNMGHPELEDLLDGKAYLVKHYNVDPARVGLFGGSYGGFMTIMALLRAPGEFAAGAAIRSVTDWSAYNHEYTSNILNTPQLDPEAYRVSSPIEYAENLADPLLLLHGLIDNNVLPDDSIRLYQRFIELHKTDFWMSLYPTERHAFEHDDAWYDEYRRIHELFTRYLKNAEHR